MRKIILTEEEYDLWASALESSNAWNVYDHLWDILTETRGEHDFTAKEIEDVDFDPINKILDCCDVCGQYYNPGELNENSECYDCEDWDYDDEE